MKKFNLILLTASIALTGCGLNQANEPQTTYTSIPEIQSTLDQQTKNEFDSRRKQGLTNRYEGLTISATNLLRKPDNMPSTLFYDSGINIAYPTEGVKGIYLPVSALNDSETMNYLLNKLDTTPLNTVVMDFKDDSGQIIPNITSENSYVKENVVDLYDYRTLLKQLEAKKIYPIARIVTFKDNYLAYDHPELSFKTKDGELWSTDGSYYTNPFLQEVWDYNVAIAIEAAKMGFKDIQFDYVRFSDAFLYDERDLEKYSKGQFESYVPENPDDAGEERVAAIAQFLAYAREKLAPYGVNVSADVFGYTAVAGNAYDVRGIGQHFATIAENVDVMSAMVYPDHWGPGFFGIPDPPNQPYDLINEFMLSAKSVLANVNNNVISRPWIQNYYYEAAQIQEQINALHDNGVHEYLLWNAFGEYPEDVNYAPELTN